MSRYEVPYICPNCGYERWVDVDPDDENSTAAKCPGCGLEDEVQTSRRRIVVDGLDSIGDVIDMMRGDP